MRFAILADIHGNSIALDAVLADIAAQGSIDGYWLLGDYCAIGSDPVGILKRVTGLSNARYIRGNTDRYITTNDGPQPSLAAVNANPNLLAKHTEVQRSMAWTQGAITATGWFNWVAHLPLDLRFTLPDGTRVLLVHAAPGTDDGDGILPIHTDAQLREILVGAETDVICVGHNHCVIDRQVDGVRVLNPGSLSNPLARDIRASYMLIEANQAGYQVQLQWVAYDHDAAIAQVQQVQHPSADYIIRLLSGQVKRPWEG